MVFYGIESRTSFAPVWELLYKLAGVAITQDHLLVLVVHLFAAALVEPGAAQQAL